MLVKDRLAIVISGNADFCWGCSLETISAGGQSVTLLRSVINNTCAFTDTDFKWDLKLYVNINKSFDEL